MSRKYLSLLAFAALAAACSSDDTDGRVAGYARARLGAGTQMRVTQRSELSTEQTRFYLVSGLSGADVTVVVPAQGELFDSTTPDAFDRVARAEQAAQHATRHGADRLALWFGALGGAGGACPAPVSDTLHFATAQPTGDGGIILSYAIEGGKRTCVIELSPDGSLKQAHAQSIAPARAEARWPENMN